jgi:hypothetical protein
MRPARERAQRELAEDRDLAEAVARTESEETYLADLRRLSLSLRAAREPAPEIPLADYQAAVRRAGEEIARLEGQLHALRPNPETDRYYYPAAQIRRRAELYEQTRQELERLKGDRIARLRELLEPRHPPAAPVPQEKLDALARQRDERIARAIADLRESEAQARAALPAPTPWPSLTLPPALGWAPDRETRSRVAGEVESAACAAARDGAARAAAQAAAFRRLREQQRQLAALVTEETAVAARNAARDLGLELQPRPSRAVPDRTPQVRAALRAYFGHGDGAR